MPRTKNTRNVSVRRRNPSPPAHEHGFPGTRATTANLTVTSRGDRKRDPCSRDGSRHSTPSSCTPLRLQRRATSKRVHHWRRRSGNSSVDQPVGSSFGQRQVIGHANDSSGLFLVSSFAASSLTTVASIPV